jgi:hypothetical protein
MQSRPNGWSMAVAVGLAASLTIWVIASVTIDLMREDSYPPWGLHFLSFSLLAMVWSGLSLLRWKSNLAIAALILSAMYALPLGMLILLFRSFSD